jgi:hypothetical protein
MSDRPDTRRGGGVRMQIRGDDLFFIVLDDARTIRAGSIAPARTRLVHEPASAAELEAAIEEIEQLIMPALRALPAGASLEGAARELGGIAEALTASGAGETVAVEEVEHLFNRLADVASGSPASLSGLPASTGFALGLVLLREIMHHGGFREVSLLP